MLNPSPGSTNRARRAAISIALGVATTALIAWPVALLALHYGVTVHALASQGGTAWTDTSGGTFKARCSLRLLGDWWQVYPPSSSDSVLPLGDGHPLPAWVATPSLPPAGVQRSSVVSVDTAAHGWPWRCVASESWMIKVEQLHPGSAPVQLREVLRGNLVLGETSRGRTIMPLRPIWWGLVADTLALSAAWFALLTGLSVARSGLRSRAGLCAVCGYNRQGLAQTAACPECGKGGVA